jgi:hypothetical protein
MKEIVACLSMVAGRRFCQFDGDRLCCNWIIPEQIGDV